MDLTPLPDSIPAVKEVGASSAPLMSASFFIGARCRPYNDDFMQCKDENPGTGQFDCLKEGRRVTRCASSVIEDINKSCLEQFRKHWQCLDNNNHQMWQCRKDEWKLNTCVFENLVRHARWLLWIYSLALDVLTHSLQKLEKTIPGTPSYETPVHLRSRQIYAHYPVLRDRGQPPFPKSIDTPSAAAAKSEA